MSNLKSITFIFENCDEITIDVKHIMRLQLEDFSESIFYTTSEFTDFDDNYSFYNDSITANKVVIALRPSADTYYDIFDNERISIFDRFLMYNDITNIILEYIDKSLKHFWVHWEDKDKNSEENLHQKTKKNKDGNLYIVIEKGKNVYSYFDGLMKEEFIKDGENYCTN